MLHLDGDMFIAIVVVAMAIVTVPTGGKSHVFSLLCRFIYRFSACCVTVLCLYILNGLPALFSVSPVPNFVEEMSLWYV